MTFNTPFNPSNWYFLSVDGRVFSTARMVQVTPDDTAYGQWQLLGQAPTPWPGASAADQTENSIRDYLKPYGWPVGSISRRQFYQQLAIAGICTQAEALAVVATGVLPAAVASIVAALPADQQFAATMILTAGGDFERQHPLVQAFGAAHGMTTVQIDAFFKAAILL